MAIQLIFTRYEMNGALGNVAHTFHLAELFPPQEVNVYVDPFLHWGDLLVQPPDIKE